MTLFNLLKFFFEHLEYTLDMLIYSTCALIGQLFIYRLIKNFKQHIAPFVTTTRKILTILISIIYYQHSTNWTQILGLIIVLLAITIEFII